MKRDPSNNTHEPADPVSAKLLQAIRQIWDSLVIGTDANSALLQLPALQLRCLRRIAQEDDQRIVDIAKKMQMPLPGVSRLVDRLARQGLVTRRPDLNDRRAVRVSLGDTARAGLAEIERKRQEKIASCLRRLDRKDVDQLIASLLRLCAAADQAQAGDPGD